MEGASEGEREEGLPHSTETFTSIYLATDTIVNHLVTIHNLNHLQCTSR